MSSRIKNFSHRAYPDRFVYSIFVGAAFICIGILPPCSPLLHPGGSFLLFLIVFFCGISFGLAGGLSAAILAVYLMLLGNNIALPDLPRLPPEQQQSLSFLFFIYFMGGSMAGYHAETDRRVKRHLDKLTQIDKLTGCYTFPFIMNLLERETSRSRRYKLNLTVALVDIDFFKKINNSYGHLVGNDLLKHFAKTLRHCLRHTDSAGRYNGEEFLLVLPESTPDQALIALERLQEHLQRIRMRSPRTRTFLQLPLSFSAGVACFPHNGDELSALLSTADIALAKAKKGGRNRIVVERRRWLRVRPPQALRMVLVDFKARQMVESVEIVDISQEGMRVLLQRPVPHDTVLCRIYFEKNKEAVEVESRIVRRSSDESGRPLVGIQFINPPAALRQKIIQMPTDSPIN
ncbi:MAG: diguanylate cyclase [Candidatus Omnitrophica bacterium]|nr:diguanylate cyclase [Candidatus Omnitrophota bacterium]